MAIFVWKWQSARLFSTTLIILAATTGVHGDVVTDWNTTTLNVIRQRSTAPPVASRALAILHLSIYDAVNGITRTHAPYRVASAPPASASTVAAASTAAHDVLVALFPGDSTTFDAIQNGDSDDNPATAGDPAWLPLITTPPFPDYISGHSTFSGAASRVLALFYGTDDIAFTTGSDFLPDVFRRFPSFSAAAAEAAASRLYGGIHFRAANEDGLQAGIDIADRAFNEFLQPQGNRSRK
jgi:hypothetical protein